MKSNPARVELVCIEYSTLEGLLYPYNPSPPSFTRGYSNLTTLWLFLKKEFYSSHLIFPHFRLQYSLPYLFYTPPDKIRNGPDIDFFIQM